MTPKELKALKASLIDTPVKSYTMQELALLYNPDSNHDAAYKRLHRWIECNTALNRELRSLMGSRKRLRTLTPLMVQTIFDHLGEP